MVTGNVRFFCESAKVGKVRKTERWVLEISLEWQTDKKAISNKIRWPFLIGNEMLSFSIQKFIIPY